MNEPYTNYIVNLVIAPVQVAKVAEHVNYE